MRDLRSGMYECASTLLYTDRSMGYRCFFCSSLAISFLCMIGASTRKSTAVTYIITTPTKASPKLQER